MARRPTRAGTWRTFGLWMIGALLAAVLVVLGAAPPASACSCAITRADALAQADVLFTGTVETPGHSDAGRYLFLVDQVFQGQVHERQWVFTDTTTCGASFQSPEPYLVVATRDPFGEGSEGDEVFTSFCHGSVSLPERLPDGLGSPVEPLAGTSPGPDADTPAWVLASRVAALAAVAAAGAAGVAGVVRRRRAPAAG